MKMTVKMAWKLIKNKKKWNIFLIALIALLLASCFLVNSIFSSMESSMLSLNQYRYGVHHGIFFDVDRETIVKKSKKNVKKDGWIGILGAYAIKNRHAKVTLGYFDRHVLKMESFKILSGRMPQKESEIAVERSRLKKFGDSVKLGSRVVLKSESGIEQRYTICGIIKDYTGSWAVPEQLVTGENTLPEVFVSSNVYTAKNYHYVFQFNEKVYDGSQIQELADLLGIDNDQIVENQQVYVEGMDIIKELTVIQSFFLVVLCLLIGIMEICLLPVYCKKYKKSYQTFSICGMKKRDLLCLKTVQYFLLLLMIVVGSLFLCGSGSLLIKKIWRSSYTFNPSCPLLIATAVLLVCGWYVFTYSEKKRLKSSSRIKYLREKSLERNLFRFCIKKGYRLFVPVMVACTMIFVLVFYSLAYLYDSNWGDWRGYPDFSMAAETTSISISSGDFEIYQERGQYFTYEEIEKLKKMKGIASIYEEPYTKGLSLNLKQNQIDNYWKYYGTKASSEMSIVKSNGNLPIYDLKYYVINTKEINVLDKAYPQYHFEKLLQKQQIILISPERQGKEQTTIQKGMRVNLGKVEYNRKKDLSKLTVDDVWQKTVNQRVAEIIRTSVQLHGEMITINSSEPTILIWEQNAGEIIKGYARIEVSLDSNITKTQYQKIQDTMQSMAATHTDFLWWSKSEQKNENRKIEQTILIPLIIFAVVMIFYLTSLFMGSFLMHREQIKYQMHIFKIYGIREKQIQNSIAKEVWSYGVISLIGFVLGIAGILLIYSIGLSDGYISIISVLFCVLTGFWMIFGILSKFIR